MNYVNIFSQTVYVYMTQLNANIFSIRMLMKCTNPLFFVLWFLSPTFRIFLKIISCSGKRASIVKVSLRAFETELESWLSEVWPDKFVNAVTWTHIAAWFIQCLINSYPIRILLQHTNSNICSSNFQRKHFGASTLKAQLLMQTFWCRFSQISKPCTVSYLPNVQSTTCW